MKRELNYIRDYDTKRTAHDMIMYCNALRDYLNSDECPSEKRSAIEKEIYYTNLLIEVRTVQSFRRYANTTIE